ncbi:CAP domain-containing protein [Actinoallomurus purpureus]|uniref:CAP domain-containing protein n=1 Tax=Actinoallomurus purpureus TaxID=478114 RepID=UPI002092BD90|nr:CAP domain-containing protein [Actinoallomurus purpureus]MCO6003578.1 CAP domain-containing protein [Actinoallomurus purpureus]
MNNNSETEAFWGTPGPGANKGRHGGRERSRARRWATIAIAGTVGLGAVAGVAYAATGGSGASGGTRPRAAGVTTSPESMPAADVPARSTPKPARKSPKKTLKPTPHKSRPTAHKPTPSKSSEPSHHTSPAAPVAGGPTGKAAQYAAQVLSLTNSERAQHGCSALTINAKLARAAQGHSADMVARHFFDHTNPDGKGPGERLAAVGYPQAAWGENIASGQQTPAAVMNSWMNSPGHRANILNCAYRAIGIGVAFRGGTPYWTQDFGSVR